MIRLILYSIFIGIFAFSCNKVDTDQNSDPQGYADSQVVGTWKITGLNANAPYDWDGNGIPETDLYSGMPPCDKDNLFIFDPNKTGSFKKSCSVAVDGVWEIYQTQFLIITPNSGPAEMERITSMSSNEFETSRHVAAPSGDIFTITKTWTRQ